MQIYIEKIVVLNVLIHILLILGVRYLTNNKTSLLKTIISIIIGIINLYFFFLCNLGILHYFIFLIIGILPFYNIKSTLLYLMFNIILGGITGIINLSINYYYEVIFLSCFVIFILIYILKKDIKHINVIINTDKEYKFKCFYDTGCIINIGFTPVIVLNEKYNINLEYFTSIDINTIAGCTKHKVYKANNVYLLNKNKKIEKHCLIILSNIDYEVMIGKNFLGGI